MYSEKNSVGPYAYHFNLLSGSLTYPNHITWNANIYATIRYTHLLWWWYLIVMLLDLLMQSRLQKICLPYVSILVFVLYIHYLPSFSHFFFLFKYISVTWYKFPVFLFTISLFYVQERLLANEKNTSFSHTYITILTR